jgi:transcriptional regulator with XRE-family HTH domain
MMSQAGEEAKTTKRVPVSSAYRQLDDHLGPQEEPYDVQAGLARITSWMRGQAAGTRGYAKTVGARLRATRTQQGLSLKAVEEKSRGRWKAVVIGSYERGDRSITVQKLAELAEFYGVPASELLPGDAAPAPIVTAPKLVIDLERMSQLPNEKAGPLARYVAAIQAQRGDYNGRVQSLRHEDLRSLAVIYERSPAELAEDLISWGVLDPGAWWAT